MTAQNANIKELIKKIENTKKYFVISEEKDFLVIGIKKEVKIRIEKSDSIFQPFGKNIKKDLPIFFALIITENKRKTTKNKLLSKDFQKMYFRKESITLYSSEDLENTFNSFITELVEKI